MSPNSSKTNNASSLSDSSVESAVSSPSRRFRSMSMASQSSASEQQRGFPKTRQSHCCLTNTNKAQLQGQRKSSSLPVETVEYLKAWMMSPEHISHPYPTDQEKSQIMADTGIELKQLTNWFVNNRKRYWKPRVEARLQQQAHVAVAVATAAVVASAVPMVTTGPNADTANMFMSSGLQERAILPAAISFVASEDITQSPVPPSTTNTSVQHIVSPTSSPDNDMITLQSNLHKVISVVTAENPPFFLPVMMPSSPHTVSELSCSSSDVGSVDSSTCIIEQEEARVASFHKLYEKNHAAHDLVAATLTTTHIETVDVHILRPPLGRKEPTIEDVTILPNVPLTRILRTFPNCALTYHRVLDETSRKKMQSRRDAEIVRIKKHYLRCFLTERETVDASLGKRARIIEEDEVEPTPRLKYRRISNPDSYWRLVCQTANHPLDEALPSLEEAALMFGYAAATS